jgi:hypothetical protein
LKGGRYGREKGVRLDETDAEDVEILFFSWGQDEKHSLVVKIVVELEMKPFDIFEGGYNLHVA